MSNTPWKTENWYTSPWNFADEVTKEFNFPKKIKFHDVTLRDGEQQAGLIFNKEQKMRALESLDKVGILDKAYTRCDQLSGGQQQRVALARTLNQNPKIILADEPVASLDPITAKQVMQDFVRINKEYKISILLNIHHVDLALKYCDRVIGIRAGEIVFDGPASTITQEQIDEVYNGAKAPTMGEGEGELPKAARAEG